MAAQQHQEVHVRYKWQYCLGTVEHSQLTLSVLQWHSRPRACGTFRPGFGLTGIAFTVMYVAYNR
jgi:hypothetical protein